MVAGPFDAFDDGLGGSSGRIISYGYFFVAKINDSVVNAVNLFGVSFNSGGAVSASHANNRHGDLFLSGHRFSVYLEYKNFILTPTIVA